MKPKIFVVDDERSHRQMIEAVLSAEGYEIAQADNGQPAIDAVEEKFYDLVIMDIRMPELGGIEALKKIKTISPGIPIILMTAYASVGTAVDALKSGASDYLTKPLDIEELKILVAKTMRFHQLEEENIYLKERLNDRFDFSSIIGRSPAMNKLFETIALVAPSEATVLMETQINIAAGRSLKEVEKEMILRTLDETGDNRTHAADILGISRRTLQLKLKEYGINPS